MDGKFSYKSSRLRCWEDSQQSVRDKHSPARRTKCNLPCSGCLGLFLAEPRFGCYSPAFTVNILFRLLQLFVGERKKTDVSGNPTNLETDAGDGTFLKVLTCPNVGRDYQ
jgi:hypothetical protein